LKPATGLKSTGRFTDIRLRAVGLLILTVWLVNPSFPVQRQKVPFSFDFTSKVCPAFLLQLFESRWRLLRKGQVELVAAFAGVIARVCRCKEAGMPLLH
jgi:hypothetical protein